MLSLRELQLLTESEFSVEETRKDLNVIVDYFCNNENNDEYLEIIMSTERQIPVEVAKEHKVFFVHEDLVALDLPDLFKEQSLGFIRNEKYLVYSGRLVFPVMDVKGDTMGFCGWDKYEKPKYLDSHNYGYKAKQTTFYGMEKLPEYYRSNKPVYVVEGIICCLYLRSIGLQAIALLGSSLTPYVIQILRRFGRRLIIIPDNDIVGKSVEEYPEKVAGEHLVKQVKKAIPEATVIQSVIAKDVDDTRLLDNHKYEEQFKMELKNVAICPFLPFSIIRIR